MLQPFWAAGMSFAPGHFIRKVPYDCCLPMVFQGEEISIGVRGWTHGYDFYAPERSVLFHEYASKSKRRGKKGAVPLFWENKDPVRDEMGKVAMRRLTSIIGIDPPEAGERESLTGAVAARFDVERERYGLGTVRDAKLFYKLFLVDVHAHKAQQLCGFVRSAAMHEAFTAHLRADGRGIDYSQLGTFDTQRLIDERGLGSSDTLAPINPPPDDLAKVPRLSRGAVQPSAVRDRYLTAATAAAASGAAGSCDAAAIDRESTLAAKALGTARGDGTLLGRLTFPRGAAASGSPQRLLCLVNDISGGAGGAQALAAAAETWLPQCDGALLVGAEGANTGAGASLPIAAVAKTRAAGPHRFAQV